MKKTLLISLIGLTTAMNSLYATQNLSFTGPTTWTPGTSITLQCNDTFTSFGGSYGLSYWFEVSNAIAPFLTITSLTYNNPFTDGNNIGTFPFSFNSTSGADAGFMTTTTANLQDGDLGAVSSPLVLVPDGTYADITDITFAVAAGAPCGTYTLRTTTTNPRSSIQVASDLSGVPIPQASFVFNVVPTTACANNDTWTQTTLTNAPAGRYLDTSVWTGSEMIVWGGLSGSNYLNTGSRYNPCTDSWTAIPTAPFPGRYLHTAVWTGSEMIVWGGANSTGVLNTGAKYNPSTDSWTTTSTTGAPEARAHHTAVWTGDEMIVWGGFSGSNYLNSGGRYDPSTDSWTPISTTGAPVGRTEHTAVWTGSEMIVWGGYNGGYLNNGGRYNPDTDTWTATSTTSAPVNRANHTAVWTGNEMIVWGGEAYPTAFNTGGIYDPSINTWRVGGTSTFNAPAARIEHSAVWTGTNNEMIVWGGGFSGYFNTGGRYNPDSDSWIASSTVGAPAGRNSPMAVWTGDEMIVWGGYGGSYYNTGARYCAQGSIRTVQSAVSRIIHGAAGAFDIAMPLTGPSGVECRTTLGTNDYTLVVTFSGNVTLTGSPKAELTSGTGCVGTGGICNGNVSASGAVVTVPLTNIANAQVINVRINGVNGATNFDFPMGFLIGDVNANRTVNGGDVAQTKAQQGATVNQTNFRSDVKADGAINAADRAIVVEHPGTSLP